MLSQGTAVQPNTKSVIRPQSKMAQGTRQWLVHIALHRNDQFHNFDLFRLKRREALRITTYGKQ